MKNVTDRQMYRDNNFSCDFLEILNCHCQSLQGPLPLSKWTKEVYFVWIFRTCKWLQTHSREQKMNGKELNRCWQPKSWCNYPSCKHTWETRTHWMQEWQCCVWERERLTLCFVCSDQYWVKGTWDSVFEEEALCRLSLSDRIVR